MVFDPAYPLAGIQPAPYNPRHLDETARAALERSIAELGMLKPLIVCDDGRLIAGHQRTNTLRTLGHETAPAFILGNLTYEDEVRFNQLHNASDLEVGDATCSVPAGTADQWVEIPADAITCDLRPRNAAKRHEILRLLTKYGPWGAIIATESGEVLVSALYAVACTILGYPCLVRYVPDSERTNVLTRFDRRYGVFSYSNLERTTWTQNRTQMNRLRGQDRGGTSRTYELQVVPRLKPGMRILDFGAGQMDYASRLRADGYDITALEFYLRQPNSVQIDTDRVHCLIDCLCDEIRDHGLFDLVVCDSVLNSVDRAEAERDVLATCAALCKPGGTVIFSGRSLEHIAYKEHRMSAMTNGNKQRSEVHFLDADGITAQYAHGVWRFQKYHSYAQINALARSHFGDSFAIFTSEGKPAKDPIRTSSWCCVARNDNILDAATMHEALTREFDLPLPDGSSYDRGADVLSALASSCLCAA